MQKSWSALTFFLETSSICTWLESLILFSWLPFLLSVGHSLSVGSISALVNLTFISKSNMKNRVTSGTANTSFFHSSFLQKLKQHVFICPVNQQDTRNCFMYDMFILSHSTQNIKILDTTSFSSDAYYVALANHRLHRKVISEMPLGVPSEILK